MAEDGDNRSLHERIGRKAARKLRARHERDRGLWFGLGMFGLIGWSVAVPTLAGAALGLWLDRLFASGIRWTLSLLLAGVALGCLNAWLWIRREQRQDDDGA